MKKLFILAIILLVLVFVGMWFYRYTSKFFVFSDTSKNQEGSSSDLLATLGEMQKNGQEKTQELENAIDQSVLGTLLNERTVRMNEADVEKLVLETLRSSSLVLQWVKKPENIQSVKADIKKGNTVDLRIAFLEPYQTNVVLTFSAILVDKKLQLKLENTVVEDSILSSVLSSILQSMLEPALASINTALQVSNYESLQCDDSSFVLVKSSLF